MYGSVNTLREMSQITAADIYLRTSAGQSEEDRFVEVLTERLSSATERINMDRERDFEEESRVTGKPVPLLIHDIANRIAGNMLENMIDQQNSKRIKRDDGQQDLGYAPAGFITRDIRDDLNLFTKGLKLPSSSWPRVSRVRSLEEIQIAQDATVDPFV